MSSPREAISAWLRRASDPLVKLRLFASSYAPLFAIAAIRLEGRVLRLTLLLIALASAYSAVRLVRVSAGITKRSIKIVEVRDQGAEVAAYVGTYLLPFLMVSQPTSSDLLAYGCFVAVVGVVYVRSSLVAINPLLYLLNYRLYSAAIEQVRETKVVRRPVLLITKAARREDGAVSVTDLADGVLLEVGA